MKVLIEIAQNCKLWEEHPKLTNLSFFKSIVKKIFDYHPNLRQMTFVELSLLLTDDQHMQLLNHQFRAKNSPTNTLSFPDYDGMLYSDPDIPSEIYLGDIAFGIETIKREAQEKNISFADHFTHLVIHSILHLIGYVHDTEEDAENMENLEITLLKSFDIKSPY